MKVYPSMSLESRARKVLGKDAPNTIHLMKQAALETDGDFKGWARSALRKASRIEGQDRLKYLETCIYNKRRIYELETWLINNPDRTEDLSDEEYRDCLDEISIYYSRLVSVETEYYLLTGSADWYHMLERRLGFKGMLRFTELLFANYPEARWARIACSALKPSVKYPLLYLEVAIKRQKKKAVGRQRRSR